MEEEKAEVGGRGRGRRMGPATEGMGVGGMLHANAGKRGDAASLAFPCRKIGFHSSAAYKKKEDSDFVWSIRKNGVAERGY